MSAEDVSDSSSKLLSCIARADLPKLRMSFEASARGLSVWRDSFSILNAAGIETLVTGHGVPQRLPTGDIRWFILLVGEDQTTAVQEINTWKHRIEAIGASLTDGFAIFDHNEELVHCNTPFKALFGYDTDDNLPGFTYASLLDAASNRNSFCETPDQAEPYRTRALKEFRTGNSVREEKWPGGRWIRALDRLTDEGGRILLRTDITNAVDRHEHLEWAVRHDALTKLLNRRGLTDALETWSTTRDQTDQVSVFHVDLDRFKAINDGYGHPAGDAFLIEIAERLKRFAPPNGLAARIGGDAFVLVVPNEGQVGKLLYRAEELRKIIRAPFMWNDLVMHVSASIGTSEGSAHAPESIEQTLRDADTAVQESKKGGRNRAVLFCPEMRESAEKRANLAAQIKKGLENEEFEPFFQPQVTYPDGQLIGFEALARWKQPEGRVASAASFIDVAKETGAIVDIDTVILEKSLRFLSAIDAGPTLSINVSSHQLADEGFVEYMLDAILRHGLSHDQVNIEVVESTLLEDTSSLTTNNIIRLANAGFQIELDDFGTGHTALASLTTFPVHQIKVDRSLVQDIARQPKKHAIASGLHLVCDKLGISAIAEGVETQAELEALNTIGFSNFQGYYFAKPMSGPDVLEWANGWTTAHASQPKAAC